MDFDIEVCRRFVESGMSRDWHNPGHNEQNALDAMIVNHVHLRFCNAFHCLSPLAVGLNRHDNRLRASRGRGACTIRVVVHAKTHGNDFSFHFAHGGEHLGMKRVRNAVSLERGNNELGQVVAAVCILSAFPSWREILDIR